MEEALEHVNQQSYIIEKCVDSESGVLQNSQAVEPNPFSEAVTDKEMSILHKAAKDKILTSSTRVTDNYEGETIIEESSRVEGSIKETSNNSDAYFQEKDKNEMSVTNIPIQKEQRDEIEEVGVTKKDNEEMSSRQSPGTNDECDKMERESVTDEEAAVVSTDSPSEKTTIEEDIIVSKHEGEGINTETGQNVDIEIVGEKNTGKEILMQEHCDQPTAELSDFISEEQFTEANGREIMGKEVEKEDIDVTTLNEISRNQDLTSSLLGEKNDEEQKLEELSCVTSEEKILESLDSSKEQEKEKQGERLSVEESAQEDEKPPEKIEKIPIVTQEPIQKLETVYSRNEKVDEILKEEETDNGSFDFSSAAQSREKVQLPNEGESKELHEISEVMYDGKSSEEIPDKDDINRQTAPGAPEAKTEEHSEKTVDEGDLTQQRHKDEPENDRLEIHFTEDSKELEESIRNSELEKEKIDVQDMVLNIEEISQEDEKIYEVEKVDSEESSQQDEEKYEAEKVTANLMHECQVTETPVNIGQIEGDIFHEKDEWFEEPVDSESQVETPIDKTPDCIVKKDKSEAEKSVMDEVSFFTEEDKENSHGEREESHEEKQGDIFLREEAEAVAGIETEEQSDKSGGENKKIIDMVNLSNVAETAIVNDEGEKKMNIGDISDSDELVEGTIQDRVGAWNEETSNSGCKEEVHQMNDEENNEVNIHEENTDVEKVEIISGSLREDQIEETYSESVAIDTRDLIHPNKEITKIAELNNTPETANTKEEGNQEKNIGDMSDTHESFEGAIYDGVGKEDEEITYSGYEEEINQNADTNDDTEVSVDEEGTDTKRLEIISDTASENQCQDMAYEAKATKIETTLGDYMSSKAVVGHETKDRFIEGDIQGGEIKGESETLTQEQIPEASNATDNVPVGIPKHEQNVVLDTEISQERDNEEQETISSKNEIVEEILREGESKDLYVTSEVMYGGRSREEVPDKEDIDSQIAPGDPKAEAEEHSKETANEGNSELDEENINVQELILNVEESCQEDEKIYEEEKVDREEISQEGEKKYEAEKVFGSCSTSEMSIEDKAQRVTNTEEVVEKINPTVDDNEVNDRNIGADLEEVTENNSLTDFNEEETDQTTEERNVDVELIEAEGEESDEEKHSAIFLPKEAEAVPGIDTEDQNYKSSGENREVIKMVNLNDKPETENVKEEYEKELNKGDISDSWQMMNAENKKEVDIQEEKTDAEKVEITTGSEPENYIEETNSESVDKEIIEDEAIMDDDSVSIRYETLEGTCQDEEENQMTEEATAESTYRDQADETGEVDDIKNRITSEEVEASGANTISHNIKRVAEMEPVKSKVSGEHENRTMEVDAYEDQTHVESPQEQFINAEDAVEVVREFNSSAVDDEKTCDPRKDACEKEFEGLTDDVAEESEIIQMNVFENEINERQDVCVSSDTEELQDEAKDEGNEIQAEIEISQRIDVGESNKEQQSEEKKSSERDNLEMVGLASHFTVQEGLQTENGGSTREALGIEETDDTFEERFQEDERKEHEEATVELKPINQSSELVIAYDTAKDPTSYELIVEMVKLNDESETANVKDKGEKEINIGNLSDSHELVEGVIHDRAGVWHEETTNSVCEEETHQILNTKDNNEVDVQVEQTEKVEITSETVPEGQIEETNSESVAPDTRDLTHQNKEISKMADPNNPETTIMKEEDTQEKNIGDISDTQRSFAGTLHDSVGKHENETTNSGYEEEINQITNIKENREISVHEEGTDNKRHEIISDTVSEDQSQDMAYEAETTKIETTLGDYRSSKAVVGIEVKDSFIEGDIQGSEAKGESEMLTGEQIPEASNATDNVPVGIPKCEHSVVLDTVSSGEKAIPEQEGEKIYEVEGNIDESRGNSELDEENIDVQNLVLNVEGSSQEDENTYDVENVESEERSQEDEKKYEAEKVLGAFSASELSIEDKGQKLTNPEEVVEKVNSTINDNEVHDRNIGACLEVVAEKNSRPDSNEEQTDHTTAESNLDVEQREGGELEKWKESFDEPTDSKRHEETPVDETPGCIMKKDKSEDKFHTDHNDVFKEIPMAEESALTEEDEGEREESHEEKHGAVFLPEEAEAVAGIDIEDQSNKSGGENKEIIKIANLNDEPETANIKEEGEKKMNIGDISDSWHKETTNSACEGETYQTMNAEENNEVDIQEEKTDVGKVEITTGSEPEYHIEETKSHSAATSIYDSTHLDKEIIEDGAIMDDDSVSIRNETVEGICQDKEKIKMIEEATPESTYKDQADETDEVDDIKNRITCEEVEDSNFNTISQNFITVAEMEPVKSKLLEEDETRTMEADAYEDQTQVESSQEQFMVAENAVREIDEVVKGSNSSEVDDGKTCDPMKNASEKEFEGLTDDVAEESQIVQRDVLENEIDEKQDDCVSSETGELEDKTQYEENEIQPYKKVTQINNIDESNKEEKSEEKKCSEKDSLEQVVLKIQSGDSSKETLEKEEINDTIEERFLEDEDKEHEEGTVELEPTNQSSEPFIACDTAKDATSHEVFEELDPNGLEETHHMMNAEDNNEVDIQEEKTDVEKVKITLGSVPEDQTEEINSESVATNTRDSVNPDKEVESSDFNTISKNFETVAEMEPAKSKLLEEVVNRTKEIDAYEEQTHDASNECKEERRVFPEEGNKYSNQQKESSKGIGITLLEEANATDKAASMSSKQSQDIEVNKLNGECGLVCEEKLQSFDPEENQIKETTVEEEALDECLGDSSSMESEEPAAAVQVKSPQEQIINAEDAIKGIDELVSVAEESEIVQRDIVENESKKKQEVCVSSETEKLEDETQDEENEILLEKKVSQTMNIDGSNKKESSEEKKSSEKDNLEQAELEKPFILGQGELQTGGGINTMEKLEKEDTEDTFERSFQEDENREDEEEATVDLQPINQSSETVIACDTAEDATSHELVMEFDSMPSIQNSLGRVLSDKIEPVSLMDKEDEKKNVEAPDADMENETTHDQFQKDEVEIEKNKEPQTTWETKSTRTMEDEIPNDNVKEFDCIPSQQNSMVVVLTEKTGTTLSKDVEGESPNDEVEFDFRPLEQNSTVTFFNEKVQTSLTEDEENEKKSFSADLKGIDAHEQFKKDEIEAYKNTEPQTTWEIEATDSTVNEFQNYEVKELDCNPSEQNSATVFLPEKLETSILMDEGDDKKKLDGLSLTTTLAEETMHEVSQKNEVSDFMLSRSTQDEEMVVELAKETSVEYPTESVHETITKDIPIDLNIRGEEVSNWTPITLLIPEETRIEAFNQKDREEIGEASNLVSKMEVDQRNYSPVEVTEDEGKSHELSIEQATEVRPPAERERVHQTEEDSSVPIEFDSTENEEKQKDFDDLPVSRLLLEHILRNKDDMHDQASDAVPLGEKLQENNGEGSSSATTEKQGVSLPAQEEIQQKVEDTSDMLQEEGSHDVKEDIMANESPNDEVKKFECIPSEQNSVIEVVTEKIKTTLLMDEEGGSPKDEVEELDFTPLGKNSTMTILNEKVQTSLPLIEEDEQKNFDAGPNTCDKEEIAHEQFKISAEPQAKWELEATDATINEFPTNEVNELDPKPSEQDSVTVFLTEKIGTVISMDEREEKNNLDILALAETPAEETMHEVSQKNEVSDFMLSKSTQDDSASAHETITKDIIVDLSVRGEEIPKWTPVAVLIPEESRFETLNQEDREEIGEASNLVPKMEVERERVQQTEENSNEVVYDKSSYTTTEGKTPSILESVGHTKNILHSEETIPNPQYNQTRKSIESSTSEIHKHEEALEIKSEITKEETGEEKHDEITERLQDVSYSQKAQQSNLKLESEKKTVQLAAGLLEERSTEISKDKEQMKEATGTQIEEEKTDEEKEEKEEEDEHKIEESGHDVAVIVEARDANSKKVHKKSHNILSGVGSKVKHSLAKVKKAITGKSSHPKAVSPK